MKKLIILFWLLIIFLEGFTQIREFNSNPDSIKSKRINIVIGSGLGIYSLGLSYLSFVWYKDHERVPFHFYNDGMGYLQMDKVGHAYVAYWESFAAYRSLRWAGVDKKRALLWGGPMGFIFQFPIEVFDGLYEGWGFSWWDVAANTFGSVLFSFQEAVFDEQLVLMKFSYSPSGYPKYHHILGTNHLESFFLDYNGHTHWLSANIRGITGIQSFPNWLNFALGYSANGMIFEFENPTYYQGKPFPYLERYRQYLFSLDIDLSRVHVKRKWVRTVFQTVNLIKVPFPAIEINRVDVIKFRPLYF